MGLNRTEKAAVVDEIGAQVAAAGPVVIVAEYRGLGVGAITGLRKQAREAGVVPACS
jgi:large subunit ribosomal protein L10